MKKKDDLINQQTVRPCLMTEDKVSFQFCWYGAFGTWVKE